VNEDKDHAEDPDATRERFAGDADTRAWNTNLKRTYDEMQAISLTSHQRAQAIFDQISTISVQHIQNAVANTDALAKAHLDHVRDNATVTNKDHEQATRHADIAIENQWESAEEVTQSVTLAAILAGLANAFPGDDATLGKAARAVAEATKPA